MKVLDFLKDNRIILDGGMGTMVESQGFSTREIERLSYQNPDLIKGIHKKYLDAGSNLILANTFGANSMRYTKEELELRDGIMEAKHQCMIENKIKIITYCTEYINYVKRTRSSNFLKNLKNKK